MDSRKKFEEMEEDREKVADFAYDLLHPKKGFNKDIMRNPGNNINFHYDFNKKEELPKFKLPSEEQLKESLDKWVDNVTGGKIVEEVDKKINNLGKPDTPHYESKKIQPLEYILANDLDFCEGNIVKYVTRYKEKNGMEDLLKAKDYLETLIKNYK